MPDTTEVLARMWMLCDPNRGGDDPDEMSTLHIDGVPQQRPRWEWFIPRAEASIDFLAKNGLKIGSADA